MGRNDFNINAIRQVTGTQINIENFKWKTSGDRTVSINGPARSIRQAEDLI